MNNCIYKNGRCVRCGFKEVSKMSIDELIDALQILKVTHNISGDTEVKVFDKWKNELYYIDGVEINESGEVLLV